MNYTIQDIRKDLNKLVEFWKSKDYYWEAIKVALIEDRLLSEDVAKKSDAFFIDEDEMPINNPKFLSEYPLGFVKNNKFIFSGRIVYPIKDVYGDVMGLIGWDKFAKPKYIDSRNYGYSANHGTFAGMEDMREYYAGRKPIFITEGYVDTLWLKSIGLYALSSLGSYLTSYQITILKRFGNRVIFLPDKDEAGDKYVKQIKYKLPNAGIFQAKYGKDVDGMRKIEDCKYLESTIKELKNMEVDRFGKFDLFMRR